MSAVPFGPTCVLLTSTVVVAIPAIASLAAVAVVESAALFMSLGPTAPLFVVIASLAQGILGNSYATYIERTMGFWHGVAVSHFFSGVVVYTLAFLAFQVGLIATPITLPTLFLSFGTTIAVNALCLYLSNRITMSCYNK